MSNLPVVSIIIPTFNAASYIRQCADALLVQHTDIPYEVIISDDGSTDNTSDLVRSYYLNNPYITYLQHENVQRAENRNIGARRARGKVLIFLDVDMVATEALVQAHFDAFQTHGCRSVIAGNIPVAKDYYAYPVGRYLAQKWKRRLINLADDQDNVLNLQSGNFSIGAQLFNKLGGFDPSFKEYGGEDIDFFSRATLQGTHFFYCQEAKAYQHVEKDFFILYKKAQQASRQMQVVFSRHHHLQSQIPDIRQAKTLTIKQKLWLRIKQLSFFDISMMHILPLLEKTLTDQRLFIIYSALLSRASRQNRVRFHD